MARPRDTYAKAGLAAALMAAAAWAALAPPERMLGDGIRVVYLHVSATMVGLGLTLVSATVSWGGIFWAEPRMRASVGVVAVALVALAVEGSAGRARLRNLTWPVSALAAFLVLRSALLYIHPDHPVQSTTPLGIRAAFIGIFVLFLVASLCLADLLHARGDPPRSSTE